MKVSLYVSVEGVEDTVEEEEDTTGVVDGAEGAGMAEKVEGETEVKEGLFKIACRASVCLL